MKEKKTKWIESGRIGSALIMTIVLTVMLSIVAVMFVVVARMDMAATSNIADNKMLESAARSIVEIISRELVLDTPGAATPSQEYYDYADVCDIWLASLQPYQEKTDPNDPNAYVCKWHQISDVTGYLKDRGFNCRNVDVNVPGNAKVVKEYPDIILDSLGELIENKSWSDADGDGIADSKWIELQDIRSSKGQRIYAAVRVIDNSGMINVDTAHTFDASSSDANKIDGKSQLQINLAGLLRGGDSIVGLHEARCGSEPNGWAGYENNVIWQYSIPAGGYLPFDISDELELRYRYCIDSKFKSQLEVNEPNSRLLPATVDAYGAPGGLYDGSSGWGLSDWQHRITEPYYSSKADRRHLLTTCSLDRVISPSGGKMTNINTADVDTLYNTIRSGLLDADSNFPNVNKVSAQIAVNIKDYRDSDSNVTDFNNPDNNIYYYGFERPCIYISELAFRFVPPDPNILGDPNHRSYAIELYKPYSGDNDPNGWRLWVVGSNPPYNINWSGSKQFYVIRWEDSAAPFVVDSNASIQNESGSESFDINDTILLTHMVGSTDVIVDRIDIGSTWPVTDGNYSIQRDITPHKCIRRLWDSTTKSPTLGTANTYISPDANMIQAHPANGPFRNIGEIGMVFRRDAYEMSAPPIGPSDTQASVYLNLADPNFQKVFKYLTVWPPSYVSDQNETRVKGRININTAPVFVIAQLPWVSHREGSYNDDSLAKAIVAYRDKSAEHSSDPNYNYGSRAGGHGFENIGQLCNVNVVDDDPNYGIDYYSRGVMTGDQAGFPDLTADNAPDDFEERDLIFARISDLVTVRSDVFTAYMLVRIGTDGPQKRYMVILDRSRVSQPTDKVYVRAFQTVPEAR